jgi:hypothetical protein
MRQVNKEAKPVRSRTIRKTLGDGGWLQRRSGRRRGASAGQGIRRDEGAGNAPVRW